jgi:hypothetical protein
MSARTVVQQWFNAQFGGSLFLPDGWYGRPYDNQHMLTSIDEDGDDLSITLDNRLMLHFKGLRAVTPTDRELIFGPFRKLCFESDSVGGGSRLTKEYSGGEVKIVTAPG